MILFHGKLQKEGFQNKMGNFAILTKIRGINFFDWSCKSISRNIFQVIIRANFCFFSHYRCAFWKLMIKSFVISMFNVGKTRNKIRSMFRRISIFPRKKLMIEMQMQESFTIIVELFQKGQKKEVFVEKCTLFFQILGALGINCPWIQTPIVWKRNR